MTAPADLIAEGRNLLARERAVLLSGALAEVGELAAAKTAYLHRFESTLQGLIATPGLRDAVATLVAEARHNERLIRAAGAGIAAARRKVAALAETRRGAVAYDRDGSRIASRADAAQKTRTA